MQLGYPSLRSGLSPSFLAAMAVSACLGIFQPRPATAITIPGTASGQFGMSRYRTTLMSFGLLGSWARRRSNSTARQRRTRVLLSLTIVALVELIGVAPEANALPIVSTSAEGFPNGRTSNDPPANAIDGQTVLGAGNLGTFTWTTEAFNTASPSHLAIGFDSTSVNRLRLWKDDDGGGGQNIKNLTIQYTTDLGPLSSRNYITVTALTSGFLGTELMNASSVNPNGTVLGDVHDSLSGDGFASLVFDTVVATGLRISFSNPQTFGVGCSGPGGNNDCSHYRVADFQAHFDVIPEPASGLLVFAGLFGLAAWRRGRA